MGKRFGDIENGGVLKLALDNLTKYRSEAATRTSSRITGSGTPKNRIQAKVSIGPFYTETTDVGKFIVNTAKASLDDTTNFAKTTLDGYYDTTPPDTAKPAPKGYSPSRARVFNPTSTAGTYAKSKFTGLYYIKRAGTGFSLPIGRKVSGDSEERVQSDIIKALTTEINATPYRRISFTDEKPPGA